MTLYYSNCNLKAVFQKVTKSLTLSSSSVENDYSAFGSAPETFLLCQLLLRYETLLLTPWVSLGLLSAQNWQKKKKGSVSLDNRSTVP